MVPSALVLPVAQLPVGGVWVGVERGGWGSDLGGLAHCWALRDQPVRLVARGLLRPLSRCFGVVVVGGCVV